MGVWVRVVTVVTLLSDFGTRDTYAGVVEGAILRVAPEARVLHLTHGVPPGAVAAGRPRARRRAPARARPASTSAIVDPGVGTDRRALAARERRRPPARGARQRAARSRRPSAAAASRPPTRSPCPPTPRRPSTAATCSRRPPAARAAARRRRCSARPVDPAELVRLTLHRARPSPRACCAPCACTSTASATAPSAAVASDLEAAGLSDRQRRRDRRARPGARRGTARADVRRRAAGRGSSCSSTRPAPRRSASTAAMPHASCASRSATTSSCGCRSTDERGPRPVVAWCGPRRGSSAGRALG